jgi:hypothetical protein
MNYNLPPTPAKKKPTTRKAIALVLGGLTGMGIGIAKKSSDEVAAPVVASMTAKAETNGATAQESTRLRQQEQIPQPNNFFHDELERELQDYLGTIVNEGDRDEAERKLQGMIDGATAKIFAESFDGNLRGAYGYFAPVVNDKKFRGQLRGWAQKFSEQYDVPLAIGLGTIAAESGFKQSAHTSVAYGLGGVSPEAATNVLGPESYFDITYVYKNKPDKKTGKIVPQKEPVYTANAAKKESLLNKVKTDKEFNVQACFATLQLYYKKYGDWGMAVAAYNGGHKLVDQQIVKVYNDRLLAEYNDALRDKKHKKRVAIKPTLLTVDQFISHRREFLRQERINFFTLVDKGAQRFAIREHVFRVLALASMASQVVGSEADEITFTIESSKDVASN